jgi:molecular chaperone DnaK
MVEQAEHFAEQDKRRREEAEKFNNADALCYQAERMLADFAAKLSDDVRRRIETSLRETRQALSKRDASLAAQRADGLKTLLQEAGGTLYAQASQPGPQPRPDISTPSGEARAAGSGPGARVVNAEYREGGGGGSH